MQTNGHGLYSQPRVDWMRICIEWSCSRKASRILVFLYPKATMVQAKVWFWLGGLSTTVSLVYQICSHIMMTSLSLWRTSSQWSWSALGSSSSYRW